MKTIRDSICVCLLRHRLDPIRFHLKAGLSMLNTRGVDVATWDGIYQIRKLEKIAIDVRLVSEILI